MWVSGKKKTVRDIMHLILVTGIENPPVYFGTVTAATCRADKSWKPRPLYFWMVFLHKILFRRSN